MGQYADAENAYARAVELDPKNPLLQERLRIAHARAEQGKTRQEP
jgi:cytochrome c-type biogenesis protein CcmH/NrfG